MKLLCASALTASMLMLGTVSAPAQTSTGDRAAPKAPATDAAGPGTLSDKLGATGGVIHPKENVDPSMDKAAPKTPGNTPVIKPPGTGGKPGPTPK